MEDIAKKQKTDESTAKFVSLHGNFSVVKKTTKNDTAHYLKHNLPTITGGGSIMQLGWHSSAETGTVKMDEAKCRSVMEETLLEVVKDAWV